VRTFGTAGFDIIPAVAPMTKYAVTVRDPSSVRYHLEQALHLALSGRPGPVWLDLPMDVQSALIDPDTLAGFIPPAAAAVPAAASVSAVLALLRGAARPLLIAGQGVRQAGGQHRLRELVELLGAPLLLSRLGQDLLSHEHPLNFGQAGVKGVKYGPAMMAGADLIVALGCRLAVPLAGEGLGHFAPDARIVMIDVDPAELAAHGARLALPVQAEVSGFIAALIEAVPGAALPDWTGWTDRCAGWRRAQPMLRAEQRGDPIDLYHFMARLNALAPQDAVFITDAGSNYYVGGQVMTFAKPGQRELTSGTFAAMGLSIPLAIGAACADPDRPILAVTGDGSLELNIQELKTLSYYRLNVKLFVINNGGYLSMRNWQDSLFEGRRIGADDKTGAETLVLRKIADAFEMPYQVIAAAADIDATLTALLARPGPVFVEVVCDDRQRIVQPFAAEMADQMADQMAAEPTGAR
jgi:acetolactate synthase-1/2/3 large subunit